mmetsp:Transcript_48507/g.113551  ORF Transcript_48507/g.113551 Transcript_48507/m.113551 type:complete len:147 (+) Transcript_48507:72-512(+)|eukprot:4423485-Amphidinium_carterae.1
MSFKEHVASRILNEPQSAEDRYAWGPRRPYVPPTGLRWPEAFGGVPMYCFQVKRVASVVPPDQQPQDITLVPPGPVATAIERAQAKDIAVFDKKRARHPLGKVYNHGAEAPDEPFMLEMPEEMLLALLAARNLANGRKPSRKHEFL